MRPETIYHVNYANECEENIEKERRYTMFTGIVEEVGTIDTISSTIPVNIEYRLSFSIFSSHSFA